MERTLNQTETEETSVCSFCREEFEQPLLAELSSGSCVEEYYACPRCLTKVGEVEHGRKAEAEEDLEEEQELHLEVEETLSVEPHKTEETQSCPHYLGYLKKRQKGTPIPEGCLTCTQMIDCF